MFQQLARRTRIDRQIRVAVLMYMCVVLILEVARTRLREEGNKYNAFWQTLSLVWREEGFRGVYRGLSTQLVRQIPNTAIMMATYEAVVYMLTTHFHSEFYTESESS